MVIRISRLQLYGYHGVLDQERRVGARFEVSAALDYPVPEAPALSDTLDYARAVEVIRSAFSEPTELLETVAQRLRRALESEWPAIRGGSVTVAKVAPPIGGAVLESVSVTLDW